MAVYVALKYWLLQNKHFKIVSLFITTDNGTLVVHEETDGRF